MNEFEPETEEKITKRVIEMIKREFDEGGPFYRRFIGNAMRTPPIEDMPPRERLAYYRAHPPLMLGIPTPDVWFVYGPEGKQFAGPLGTMEQAQGVAQVYGGEAKPVIPAWTALSKENQGYFMQLVADWEELEKADAD